MHAERSLRVAFLLQDLKHGGTQKQALALARRLDPARFPVAIWTLAAGDDLDPAPIPRIRLAAAPAVSARALASLGRALRRNPPDLLVTWTVVPNIWGRIMGRLARVPAIVGNCRGGDAARRQHERWLWRFADHVVCNAGALKSDMVRRHGVPASHVTVVSNGVDLPALAPPPRPDPPIILCVARLVPEKDHATLLAAFREVRRRRPDAQLWLVGDGPERERIGRALRGPDAAGLVWIPAEADVGGLVARSAVFAMSSRVEAMPNAVLEAMAGSRPVVATSVGGLPEIVDHGRTGLLVPPGRPDELAGALLDLLSDPDRAAAMGAAGRARVEREFTVETMVRAYSEIFERCAARRRPA
jgi:glycosyltransferase involved in cell wall biosynthesis